MSRSRITIDAPVLAPAIWVQARFEADIRARIARDDRSCSIAKILCRAPRFLFGVVVKIDNVRIGQINMQFFKTVCRAPGRTASSHSLATLRCFDDDGLELPIRQHGISSHEHIALSNSSSPFCWSIIPSLHHPIVTQQFDLE